MERVQIMPGLRLGEFDVLVAIYLIREGLDLPAVSLWRFCCSSGGIAPSGNKRDRSQE